MMFRRMGSEAWEGVLALEFPAHSFNDDRAMPLHPEVQQLIQQVEELSGRLVHVMEDPELKVMRGLRESPSVRAERVC